MKDFFAGKIVKIVNYWNCGDYAQFDEYGENIYFYIKGENEHYLCKTNGLTEGTSYDTIAPFPKNLLSIALLKD